MIRLLITALAFVPAIGFAASVNGNAGGAVRGQDRAVMVQERNVVRQEAKLEAFKAAHPLNVEAAAARQAALDARKARIAARSTP
ncbi:MAG: hypothetical protein H0X45_12175 [Planctomycetes bacterium]|nr:hypothetical protein [Planctomycetota bacterium]